jgi:hypothetical protein
VDFPVIPGAFDMTIGQVDGFVAKVNPNGGGLVYATYLGGSGMDSANGIAVSSGLAYVTGETDSTDFPVAGATHGENDIFVVALNSGGTGVSYAMLVGGSDEDKGFAIAADAGSAYVTGTTYSDDFPGGAGLGEFDAFALKVTAGSIAYVHRLGGGGDDYGLGIAARNGEAYIAGQSYSGTFQGVTTSGGGDAFAIKMTAGGGVDYVRILGGSAEDKGQAIAVDASGAVHLAGSTSSANFPATAGTYGGGAYDAFVAQLGSGGAVVFASFLGGNGWDEGRGIAVDAPGVVDVAGFTASTNFPVTADAYDSTANGSYDVFAARLDANGAIPAQPVYATYLGGAGEDKAQGASSSGYGALIITGYTRSTGFPITTGALQTQLRGSRDGFAARVQLAAGGPETPTIPATATLSPTGAATATASPTSTRTATASPTATNTATDSPTATLTASITATPTATPTSTATIGVIRLYLPMIMRDLAAARQRSVSFRGGVHDP